jgi:ABC-type enterochelin transport system permease subunit
MEQNIMQNFKTRVTGSVNLLVSINFAFIAVKSKGYYVPKRAINYNGELVTSIDKIGGLYVLHIKRASGARDACHVPVFSTITLSFI